MARRFLPGEHLDGVNRWLAHRAQFPHIKCNHCLVIGSDDEGVGKDSYLRPMAEAVGAWNFREIGAEQALHPDFNPFLKSVILRINEVHDLGEKRFLFNDRIKTWVAAPPDYLPVADKGKRLHPIANVLGVVILTNHLLDGIFLKSTDRRHYVIWILVKAADFDEGYWAAYHKWCDEGGDRAVAAYLKAYDLSGFNPKAPPPRTEAWHQIVNANRAPQDSDLADVLDILGADPVDDTAAPRLPSAVTLEQLARTATEAGDHDLAGFLRDKSKGRALPHRMGAVGYTVVGNPSDKQGMWSINSKRVSVYALASLNLRDRLRAVASLLKREKGYYDRKAKAGAGANKAAKAPSAAGATPR